jgi:uncharacterized protein
MPKTALATFSFLEPVLQLPADAADWCDDELGDSPPRLNVDRLLAEVCDDDLHLAAIVGINGAGRVEDGQALFEGKAAAWPDLSFIARRQADVYACSNETTRSGLDDDLGGDCSHQVHTRRKIRSILRKPELATLGCQGDGYCQRFTFCHVGAPPAVLVTILCRQVWSELRLIIAMPKQPCKRMDRWYNQRARVQVNNKEECNMAEVEVEYFETAGAHNTEATLQAAAARAADLGIGQIVVATSTGKTALRAAELLPDMDTIVAVTLHAGLWEVYAGPDTALVAEAEDKGVKFLTGVHALMGSVASAIQSEFGGLPAEEIIARTYYTISQGTKVCVECMIMAADAGLLNMDEDVISIAGTNGGADTAMVVKPTFSNKFFQCRVREFIAMPRADEGAH